MILTAEISFYPLTHDFEARVIAFIRALRGNQNIKIKTGGTSTLICGESDAVFEALRNATNACMSGLDTDVLVIKLLNTDAFDAPEID
jgi:uncharacterized protein YqgV (UPF0045/DUF77 family)